MSRSIVTRLSLIMALSMILLGGSLVFLARRGVEEVSRTMESTTDRILGEDIRNKIESDERAADAYGKAMAEYLAWIALPILWDYNYKALADYTSGMLNVPNVLAATIYKANGSVAAGELWIGSKDGGRRTRLFTSDIVRNGEKIGSVEIAMSTAHLEHLRRKNEETQEELFSSFQANTAEAEHSVMRRMLLFSAFVLMLLLTLNTFSIFKLVAPLRGMTRAIRRLGEMDSSIPSIQESASTATADRSLASLANALARLKEQLEQAVSPKRKDELAILSSALVSMSTLLRSRIRIQESMSDIMSTAAVSRTKEDLAWDLLRLVMKETSSCMGAFYIRNEAESKTLDLVASAGLPSDTVTSLSTTALEGQFGAPVLANEVLLLDIPPARSPSFATIAGNFTPVQILTLPLTVREKTVALFTMGSLRPYPEEYVHAFSIARESLNAVLANLLAGERERELIQNLQAANQELAAQSEELEYQAQELEEQNSELNIQRRKSEQASRLKTEFLSNMSHELRTPLNSILALSRVLRTEGKERLLDQEQEYLNIIERNGKNLLGLINGILDLSRIEAGREELRLKPFKANHLLLEVTESMHPLALEKGISLECNLPQELPPVVTDEEKLRRIITNIASNAVKFTEKGFVRLDASSANGVLLIVVEDTGIGIEPDELPFIFDEFRQSDGSMARKFEGTGLGLAIAKKYAELLGIALSVESISGKGTTFTLNIPLNPVPGWIPPVSEISPVGTPDIFTPRTHPPHLYIVEDNPVSAMQIRRMLENEGFIVSIYSGGRTALNAMERLSPDGVLLDLMMPGMDGFEFLEELRLRKYDTPVLVFTAKVLTSADTKRLNEYGVRHLALKGDIDMGDLVLKIRTMMSQGVPPANKENHEGEAN